MSNTKNSPEYQILFYLNRHNERRDITVDSMVKELPNPDYELRERLTKLINEEKYVGYKENTTDKLTITSDGQKRLSKMTTDIEVEELQKNVNKNIDTTKTLSWVTGISAAVSAIAIIFQVYFASQQNQILRKQLQLEWKQYKQQCKSESQPEHLQIKIDIK